MIELSVDIQANRKALILQDITDIINELGVAEGWGTDYTLSDYATTGSQTATIGIVFTKYDGTQETLSFDLSALGFFDGITSQSELVFNLVYDGSTYSLIKSSAFDPDSYTELSDGIFDITYTLTTTGSDVEFDDDYVLSAGAEEIIDNLGINLDSKLFSSESTDLVQLIDILALDSVRFIIDNSNSISERSIVINMLKAINDGEYDYYAD